MSLSLTEAVNLLKSKKWIDLTHAFNADSPHFFMFEPAEFKTLFDYRDGFFAQQFTFPGQYGTHIDAPCHFVQGRRFVHDLELRELVLPLVEIEQTAQAPHDPDFA